MREHTALAIGAALAPLLLPSCGRAQAGDDRPNVVLVSFDTLRADHVSCYGYGRKTTAEIDALARDGVLFSQAYSHSNKTGPSHMSVLTGLLPAAHGVLNLAGDGSDREGIFGRAVVDDDDLVERHGLRDSAPDRGA